MKIVSKIDIIFLVFSRMIFDNLLIRLKTAQHMKNLQKQQYLLCFLMIFTCWINSKSEQNSNKNPLVFVSKKQRKINKNQHKDHHSVPCTDLKVILA